MDKNKPGRELPPISPPEKRPTHPDEPERTIKPYREIPEISPGTEPDHQYDE